MWNFWHESQGAICPRPMPSKEGTKAYWVIKRIAADSEPSLAKLYASRASPNQTFAHALPLGIQGLAFMAKQEFWGSQNGFLGVLF